MEQGARSDHAGDLAGRQMAIQIAHTRLNDATRIARGGECADVLQHPQCQHEGFWCSRDDGDRM